MTTIKVNEKFIELEGHSGYGTEGNDIVCSAISTLSEATYNYLKCTKNKVRIEEKSAYYKIILEELNEQGKSIINEFITMVDDLESQYSNYIRRLK